MSAEAAQNLLDVYRGQDKRNAQGEVVKEQETLNPLRLQHYLNSLGIQKVDEFKDKFKYANAMAFLSTNPTGGEAAMKKDIEDTQKYLAGIGQADMIEQDDPKTFTSSLDKFLMRDGMQDKREMVMKGYEAYQLVKSIARKLVENKEHFQQDIAEVKEGVHGGMSEGIATLVDNLKKGWDRFPDGLKAGGIAGIILIGGYMLADDDYRSKFFKALKVTAGASAVGVVGYAVWKMVTGEGPVDWVSNFAHKNSNHVEWWQKAFATDKQRAEYIRTSTVFLGDKSFMDVAASYRSAKATGNMPMDGVPKDKLSPHETFLGVEAVFAKYNVDQLTQRFRNYQPPLKWADMIGILAAEDGNVQFDRGILEATTTSVEEYTTRGWNWLMVGEGLTGVGKYMYLKVFGRNGTEQQVKDWIDSIRANTIEKESEVGNFLDTKMSKATAQHYKDVMKGGSVDQQTGVKFVEVAGDSMYAVIDTKVDYINGGLNKIGEANTKVIETAEKFYKARFGELGDELTKFWDVNTNVRVREDASYKLFVRMPLRGSAEYQRKTVLLNGDPNAPWYQRAADKVTPVSSASRKETPGAPEIEQKEIKYESLSTEVKESLRIWFGLDDSQKDEINKVLKVYVDKLRQMSNGAPVTLTINNQSQVDEAMRIAGVAHRFDISARDIYQKKIEDIEQKVGFDQAKSTEAKVKFGNKYVLALLGDSAAGSELGFDKSTADAEKKLFEKFQQACERFK